MSWSVALRRIRLVFRADSRGCFLVLARSFLCWQCDEDGLFTAPTSRDVYRDTFLIANTHPPRITLGPWAQGYRRVSRGCCLMSEVPLHHITTLPPYECLASTHVN